MQRQHHPNDHQDCRQVQEVKEHIAYPGDLGVKRPNTYAEYEYLVYLRGVRLTFKVDPAKDQRKVTARRVSYPRTYRGAPASGSDPAGE